MKNKHNNNSTTAYDIILELLNMFDNSYQLIKAQRELLTQNNIEDVNLEAQTIVYMSSIVKSTQTVHKLMGTDGNTHINLEKLKEYLGETE